MKTLSFEKLAELKQNGEIGWCEFALRSEYGTMYLKWCDDHSVEPDDLNAELFLEQTEKRLYDDSEPVMVID